MITTVCDRVYRYYATVCACAAKHTVVTLCVCLFRVHLLFPCTLGKGKCFYGYYTVFSKYVICRFAKQSLVFEIWQHLLTSKAFVSAYDSSESKAVLSRLPFGLKYRNVQKRTK